MMFFLNHDFPEQFNHVYLCEERLHIFSVIYNLIINTGMKLELGGETLYI